MIWIVSSKRLLLVSLLTTSLQVFSNTLSVKVPKGYVFRSEKYGIEISLPEGWNVSTEYLNEYRKSKSLEIAGLNKQERKDASKRVECLFSVQKFPAGSAPGRNSSFKISIGHMKKKPAPTEGAYQKMIVNYSSQTTMKMTILSPPKTVSLGGAKFSVMDTLVELKGYKIYLRSYDRFLPEYIMNVSISTTSPAEIKEIDQLVHKLKLFEKLRTGSQSDENNAATEKLKKTHK